MSKIRSEAVREEVLTAIKSFQNKHLRLSTEEDEGLEFKLDQRWGANLQAETANIKQEKRQGESFGGSGEQLNFYGVCVLLFSQMGNEAGLDLQIMDTMFFLPDHSICYLYRDPKKGLTKLKQRGIQACQTFVKRNSRKRQPRDRPYSKSRSTILGQQRSEKSLPAHYDYFALLKYKDSSFLRLKETDLRSIFTNPLYANERFKHNNCTQYIQILPCENAEEQRIQFSLQKFKNEPLMEAAKDMQLGKVGPFGSRSSLRKMLQEINPTIYLYFTIFELVAFVAIHYNKQIKSGNFHFVCQDGLWSLAHAEHLTALTFKERKFRRYELWATPIPAEDDLGVKQTGIFQEKAEKKTLFAQAVENYFVQTNENIKKGIVDFIKTQVEKIIKPEDQLLSRSIFGILHPGQADRFCHYLNSPQGITQPRAKQQSGSTAQQSRSAAKQSRSTAQKATDHHCPSAKLMPKRSIREQMMLRQLQKKEYIYRGIQS